MKLAELLRAGLNFRGGKTCAAVVPAAGLSTRMGAEDKLFLDLNGVPVLARTLRVLEQCPSIRRIVVVTREENLTPIARLIHQYGIKKAAEPVTGGATRCESVYRGVFSLPGEITHVAVHDGARPLLSPQLLDRVLSQGMKYGAAVPGIAVKDTIKVTQAEMVKETLPRETLAAIQTPQVFDIDLLKAGLKKAMEGGQKQVTDDASAVEALGMRVTIVPGEERNIKITTPEDVIYAQALLQLEEQKEASHG